MKILLVSEYFEPYNFGGGEISAKILAQSLAKEGHDVTVLTSWFSNLPKSEQREYRTIRSTITGKNPGTILGNFTRLNYTASLRGELNRLDTKFDIIHCLNNTATIGAENYSSKKFATVNSYVNLCPKANLYYKEKEVCDGCNPLKMIECILNSEYIGRVKMPVYLKYNPLFWLALYLNYSRRLESLKSFNLVCVSGFILEFIRKQNLKGKKIYNIFIEPQGNKKLNAKLSGIVYTYIGSLDKIKGVDMLIRAFAIAGESNKTLLIVGDGPQKEELVTLTNSLGLKNVIFIGKLSYECIPEVYKKSDVICLAAKWPEPFSRALLEAAYFGKPIIATNSGGNSECCKNNINGFLADDETSFAKAIKKLENKKIREKMSSESKKIFKEKFDSEKILKELIDFYNH
ncbi:MAG: glycosyltransferase family 4 protein [archaeon]